MTNETNDTEYFSEQILRATLYSIADAVISTDSEGRVQIMNPMAEHLTAWIESEARGHPIQEVFHILNEETRQPVENPVTRVLRDGIVIGLANHTLLISRNGEEYPIADSGAPIKSSKGSVIGTVLVFRDQTAERKAQRAVQDAREFAESIVATVREPLLVLDEKLKVVAANPSFYRIFQVKPDETIGQKVYDLGNRQWNISKLRSLLEDILPSNSHFDDFEITHDFERVGRRTMVLNARRLFREENRTKLILLAIEDITERKQAEEEIKRSHERLNRFFLEDLTGDYISTTDGRLLACNPAFLRIFGFASPEEALATNISILFPSPEERQRQLSLLQRERKLDYYETQMRKLDGTPLYITANIIGHFDTHDRLIEMQGYVFDDTRQRTLEEQLRQAQKLESLGTLASGIAHDFNNILGIIMGHASLLERLYPPSETSSKSLEAVQKATQRGAALVRQLLTFARKTEFVTEPVRINDVIHEVTTLIHETFPKTIEVTTDLHKNLPAITADHTQLHQVILNLCINARDAMPQGGSLIIRTRLLSGNEVASRHPGAVLREYVMIEVQDTGIGMDESTRQRIFEPFFTTKGIGKGTGLGLSVIHGIAEAHSGFIDVESTVGKGSTFRVYLPVGEPTILEYQSSPQLSVEVQGGFETILIVEDEPMLRELLLTLLASKGYDVLAAEDGNKAVELYTSRHEDIALVISDMGLPLLSGEDVFKHIQRINPHAKVILASGFVEPLLKSELLKSGVQDFIQKPYTLNEVLQKTRKVLDAGR
jgi:PAS domain S-box-containing protein